MSELTNGDSEQNLMSQLCADNVFQSVSAYTQPRAGIVRFTSLNTQHTTQSYKMATTTIVEVMTSRSSHAWRAQKCRKK